jgi:flagellar biosynthesis protein FliQ
MKLGRKDYLILTIILTATLAIGLLNEAVLRRLIAYGFMLIFPALTVGVWISWFLSSESINEDFNNPME